MRITVFLLLAAFMQVHAVGYGQKVTIEARSASLQQVFQSIRKQTGYAFFFKKNDLAGISPVTAVLKDMPLNAALDTLLQHQPLSYTIEGNTVFIVRSIKRQPLLPPIHVKGKVTDVKGNPIPGVSVQVKGRGRGVQTNAEGEYDLPDVPDNATLVFTSIGFERQEAAVGKNAQVDIVLKLAENKLTQVSVISTGYETVSKERSTGSYFQMNQELFDRSVTTDVLGRLRDVVPGLIFDNNAVASPRNKTNIFIRGQSVLSTRTDPLIVIDNFPYEGDLNNINPNDVESISVLKDAAAASIWGARAGNGVIVIVTKKGKYGQRPSVSFNSNVTVGEKTDLYYLPKISSADYIEMEKTLFTKGFYNSLENNANRSPLTPVVELLIRKREGLVDGAEADRQIEALKAYDVRKDFEKYFLQNPVNQQYSLNVSGGSEGQRYYVSAGYDHNLNAKPGNGYDRITINANNTYSLLKQKLEVNTGIYFTMSKSALKEPMITEIDAVSSQRLYPYAQLADENGRALAVNKYYRGSYLDTAGRGKLLDWKYRPLDELQYGSNTTRQTDYRVNAGVKYRALPWLSAEALYQYNGGTSAYRNIQSEQNYYVRDLINKFSSINDAGVVTRPIPLGGILDIGNTAVNTHSLRTQLSFSKTWSKHVVSAIAGWEVRDQGTLGNTSRSFGYSEALGTSKPVSYTTYYRYYHNSTSGTFLIPRRESESDLTDRFRSYYTNFSYAWAGRYILYGSARIDQSNLFGVETNQKSVPLWSAGAAWNVHAADFYRLNWLPVLKIRTSYGYAGNVDKSLSAYTTAYYSADNGVSLPFAMVVNPPNPKLRWEKIGITNLGIDFETSGQRISGSIEVYRKSGIDLIGSTELAPQTGRTSFKGNFGSTLTKGVELNLQSRNLTGAFQWNTVFLFTALRSKVTGYDIKPTVYNLLSLPSSSPNPGKPLSGIYSYPWAGLDPSTGDPLGYNGKEVSNDYQAIYTNTTVEDLVYHGPGRPVIYGGLRNTFSWKGISLSANISYRLGYYVRKESVNYGDLLSGKGIHGDYYRRWQKPGDEAFTDIPSEPAGVVARRDEFFLRTPAVVDRGDHIRLQDVTASYELTRDAWKQLPVRRIQVYMYLNNVGLLWKANRWGMDPDALDIYTRPVARTMAFGLKADF
ncbi:SusC/RagA family TonB-linked outer membrane protein [Chitinophaga sp. 22620]|uniref:SusC/RagA family TonB-linked outer membrane protein n=1 Tax=Chitinophaga sp. 22620 TaxID=3453952 RepID=UPI003F87DF4A